MKALSPYLKAIAGALAPFFLVWADHGDVDLRAVIYAGVISVVVFFVPNLPRRVR